MDFFDLSKPCTKTFLKSGQTNGFIKVDDSNCSTLNEPLFAESTNYSHKYILQEKKELFRMYNRNEIDDVEEDFSDKGYCADLSSVGTFADMNKAENEKFTEVYDLYLKDKPKKPSNLIISHSKSKILSMIELNEVTIITGPTGCGKTTQVPQYILDSYAERNEYCNIVISQPRRIAAITIPKRVCDERNWTVGTICGYKVGLKELKSSDTRILYVTVGVLLQHLLHNKNMNDYTHVIVDEVHERDQALDFLLLVVKKYLFYNSRNVKVILMSATADASKFANYFERPICGKLQPAPIINIEQTNEHSLQIHYLEELSPLGDLPVIRIDDPNLSDVHIMIGIKLIRQFDKLDSNKDNKKSVLIFLPGIFEIEEFYNKLKDPAIYMCGGLEYKWHPVPLHSSITIEEQVQAFLPPPTGYRKIILATNIAESSITVPDVMFVIDYCITKVLVTDPETNFTSLQLSWASKANLTQRGGRAGRVMVGRVYRMIYRDNYEVLEEYSMPGMLRCPLEKVVLQAKLLEMGSPKAILALALDPPDLKNIEKTILILKEVGGLLRTCNNSLSSSDGDLTFLGRLMAEMPVDIYITKLIALGLIFNCLEECIIMGAAMSLKSVFSNPFQARLKSYNMKLAWADGSCSDCIAFLNVYEVWKNNHTTGYFKRSQGGGEVSWAKRHFIQLRTLKEVQILIDEIKMRLKRKGIDIKNLSCENSWTEIEKTLVLKFVVAGAFYPNYFTRGARGGQVDERDAVKTLCGKDPFTTVYLQNYPTDQPPDLYSNLIREKMLGCMEDMKITYDHSKVFIEFGEDVIIQNATEVPFNSKVPGRISMGVYRAVKMRETLRNIEIKVLPIEKAKEKAKFLQAQKLKEDSENEAYSGKNVMCQSVLPGSNINFVNINITHIENPRNFWATQADSHNAKHNMNLSKWLNDPKLDLEIFCTLPKVGEMCAAPYKSEDNETLFYRARIEAYDNEFNKNMVKVFFIDYGNSEMVNVKDIRKYGPRILTLVEKIPALAFQCALANLKPSPIKAKNDEWHSDANKRFEKLLENGELVGAIYSVVNGIVFMVLYKFLPNYSGKEININKVLVNDGYAEVCDESFPSKMNNELRKEKQLNENDAYNSTENKEIWIKPPPVNFLAKERGEIPVKLRGPFSPLEMTIYSSTEGGRCKAVKISSASINSVLLDSDPQDPHERLLVAGHVSQNQSGTTLILHNTTLMPNIHGLAALVPFVFAPTVELRINERRTMYTGLLCGLGADENGSSLFPEHDMEIIFDCEFNTEDFTLVNKLRFFMSNFLLRQEEYLGRPDFLLFQSKIKKCFLALIAKKRQAKELEYPLKQCTWKLVESDLIISDPQIVKNSEVSIFPIHPGVSIESHAKLKKELLQHLDFLAKTAASRKEDPNTSLQCRLCNMDLLNWKFLSLHLTSDSHIEKAKKLRETSDCT